MKLKIKITLYIFISCILIQKLNFSQNLNIYNKNTDDTSFFILKTYKINDSVEVYKKLNEFILAEYNKGFYSAGFDSIVYLTNTTNAFYNSGEKYFIKKIDINTSNSGIRIPEKKIKEQNFNKLNIFFNKQLNEFTNKSYPFAKVVTESFVIKDDSISVKYVFELGDTYIFDSIILKGDAKIKAYYINKILNLKSGEEFNYSKIKKINKNILNETFLEQEQAYQLAFNDNKCDIILYLKNKKASSFSGVLGILPNNTAVKKLLLTGELQLNLINTFSRGELIFLNWQKYSELSQNLDTKFSYPYLFKSDFGMALEFNLEKRDSSWLNTVFTTKILYDNSNSIGFNLFFENKNSILLNNLEADFLDIHSKLFGLGFKYITTDKIVGPTNGIILNLNTALGIKQGKGEGSIENHFQTKNAIDFTLFTPIYNNVILKLRSNTKSLFSKKLYENELDRIGGLNTIRGFSDLIFPVSSYSILNTEIIYRFEESSSVFVLYDFAYFEKRNTKLNEYKSAMSFGTGIELNTGVGLFSLVWAVGKLNSDNFLFNASKIHFGYRNIF